VEIAAATLTQRIYAGRDWMRVSESVGRTGFRCLEWCCFPFVLMPLQSAFAWSADELVFVMVFAAYALFAIGVGVLVLKERNRRVRLIGFALHGVYAAIQGLLWWSLLSGS
jgi:hypothetical protein